MTIIESISYDGLLQFAGAIILAVVAIWGQSFREYLKRAKIKVVFDIQDRSCFHKTALSYTHGSVAQQVDVYWANLSIENYGKIAANNVEVFLESYSQNGNKRNIMINLDWSFINKPYLLQLPPMSTRQCCLGHIEERIEGQENLLEKDKFSFANVFKFTTTFSPHHGATTVGAGVYEAVLSVTAANCRPVRAILDIAINRTWRENELDMIQDGFSITVRKVS